MKNYYIEDIHEKDAHYPERKSLIGKRIAASEIYIGIHYYERYVICVGEIEGEEWIFAGVKLSDLPVRGTQAAEEKLSGGNS